MYSNAINVFTGYSVGFPIYEPYFKNFKHHQCSLPSLIPIVDCENEGILQEKCNTIIEHSAFDNLSSYHRAKNTCLLVPY